MFWRLALALCVLGLLAVIEPGAVAQVGAAREPAVKAAFLTKFPAFVEWPAGTFQRADEPIVIGVVGDDEVEAELEHLMAGRNVEGRPVQVRRLTEAGPFTGVHVLYVANRREARLREIVEAAPGPVLVVADQPGGLRAGAVLNFGIEGGRVRFSASLTAADLRSLKLSSRLLGVAQSVESRAR